MPPPIVKLKAIAKNFHVTKTEKGESQEVTELWLQQTNLHTLKQTENKSVPSCVMVRVERRLRVEQRLREERERETAEGGLASESGTDGGRTNGGAPTEAASMDGC
ncbi:hypothetical protein AAHE18_07G155000 [Arachis hypogaea]